MAIRTGYKGWNTLEEYDTYHGTATGVTKPNVPSDPDYVAPVYDTAMCSPQEEFLLFTTTSTSSTFSFTVSTGSTPVVVEARQGSTVVDASAESATGSKTLDLSSVTGNVNIYIRGAVGVDDSVITVVSDENNVVSENMSAFPNIEVVHFRDNDLTALTLNPLNNPSLISLAYNLNNVTSFNPSGFQNLEVIDGRDNEINSVTLENLPKLRSIAFSRNNLTEIDTSELPLLDWVELTYNNLTQAGFDFTPNPLVVTLLLASNSGITSFDPTQSPNVTWLTIDKTAITSIDMTLMPDIESLDITQCPIPAFSISTNNNLTSLRCGECTFTNDVADPAIVDAVIIKMDSNITSGGTLHYDTSTALGIQPTNASRAAYDSLVLKGTDLQGKVPLP